MAEGSARVRFGGDFDLDSRAYELRRAGRALKLEHIPMELLLLLVEQHGQLVAREQIVERIWGKGVFLDTDNSINGAIRKIRQALKDDPDHPRFIQTIPGRGYRFIALISVDAEPQPMGPPQPADRREGGPRRSSRTKLLLAGAVSLLAVSAVLMWRDSKTASAPPGGRVMLAVLPFDNLTGDSSQDYFSDGLTEEMIGQLGRTDPQRLGVIARTSVMHYQHNREPLDQIGRKLRVNYVLEGSVRRDAGRVRISAQLIQMKDQTHVWARHYDHALGDLLTLQDEIAREIAAEILPALGDFKPNARRGPSPAKTYAAYDLYLKARYFWNKRTGQGFKQAVDYFQQAIASDPTYPRAYAGLADSYALMSAYSVAPASELIPKARAAAIRALELDEGLAEAHTSLALIALNYEWDWHTAEKEYRRAIELDVNYATAHHWYAEFLSYQARFDEALEESDRARQLDPLSLIIATDRGAILYYARQHDRAIEQLREVLDMEPKFPRAHIVLHAYVEKGMFEKALAQVQAYRAIEQDPWSWGLEAFVYGRWGRPALAREALAQFERANRNRAVNPTSVLPLVYAGMNEKEMAFAWLQKAADEHSHVLVVLKVEPAYDSLRGDPRFQDLLHRVGLDR